MASVVERLYMHKAHLNAWMNNFSELHLARKAVLRLTVVPTSSGPSSTDELGEQIMGFFEDLKVGPYSDPGILQRDYQRMQEACGDCLKVPTVKLLHIYRDATNEEYNKVIRYFGADYLTTLLNCDYFDNFKAMDDLIAYIDEDPTPLGEDTERTDALCITETKLSLHEALMNSMTLELRREFWVTDCDVEDPKRFEKRLLGIMDKLSKMERPRHDDALERRALLQKIMYYDDSDKFYEYARELSRVELQDEPEDYWAEFHARVYANFGAVRFFDSVLRSNPITSKETAEWFLGVLKFWLEIGEEARPGYVRGKTDMVSALKEKDTCIVCSMAGTMEKHLDVFDCPFYEYTGDYDWYTGFIKGTARDKLLSVLDQERAHKRQKTVNSVYTDGSFVRIGMAGAGVYFGRNHPRNLSLKVEAHNPQQTELLAIVEALTSIRQWAPDDTFELYTDSDYALRSLTEWYKKWVSNGWTNVKGGRVSNRQLIESTVWTCCNRLQMSRCTR